MELTEADIIFPSTDLETYLLLFKVNEALGHLVRLVQAPNPVNRPEGAQQRDRGIALERELRHIVRRDGVQLGRIKGCTHHGVQGRVHGPLEPCHVREVGEVATRWKGREECREVRAIFK